MAEELTHQQRQAVENRGGKLLVSAAAGSGKTKVLVDRLIGYVLDPACSANLDEFLIITYTKAAATELRGKIAARLSEHMAAHPENRHLQRQMQRLYLAKISTVHAFCGDLLREYAYFLDIPGDFRVADETECRQLREAAAAQVLEQAYQHALENQAFRAFVDTQGLGRDDRTVPEMICRVYDSARCHLDPRSWLEECVCHAQTGTTSDAGQTVWGRYLMEELFAWLDWQMDSISACAREAERWPELTKVAALLRELEGQLRFLSNAETWDQVVERKKIEFGRMTFPRKLEDPTIASRIKQVREQLKKELGKRLRPFADVSSQVLADLDGAQLAVKGLIELAQAFGKSYDAMKRRRHVLDFGDLEHKTLDLLLGKARSGPTRLANEIGSRFWEVMVDEYQDSNAVQDAIFSALTQKRQNCFLVGDVKQSIYQFRLADPGIFLEKYHTYASVEEAEPGQGRRVLLSSNFRSCGAVLEAVNDVFTRSMCPAVGGLQYGPAEALVEGISHEPLEEPEVELHSLWVQEDTYEEEAAFVAERICQMLDGTHFVRDKVGLRPIVPEDIVILLRSPNSVGQAFQNALNLRGIPCVSGKGQNLLETAEISTLRAILQIISNPRQDIPLLAALMSPVFCFTAGELAHLRREDRTSCLYDLLAAADTPKAVAFVRTLEGLRRKARLLTIAQLLEQIFVETRLDSIFGAMMDGERRGEHLRQFYSLAVDFEATLRRDLQRFLEYLDALEEQGLTVGEEPERTGAVTLMSIHKSKGLEFPVVFLCGLSRRFSNESQRSQVLIDSKLGLGLSALDESHRIRYPTIAKWAVSTKMGTDSRAEELRVLYVAMTRAKDRLIMTYASRTLDKDLQRVSQRLGLCSDAQLAAEAGCPGDWVLLEAMNRTEAGELFALGGISPEPRVAQRPWRITVSKAQCNAPETSIEMIQDAMFGQIRNVPQGTQTRLRESLDFRYGHMAATSAPSKQTATQRKGRQKDQEAAEQAPALRDQAREYRRPSFLAQDAPGRLIGNAMHRAMQFLCFEACGSLADIRHELDRLTQQGLLSQQQRALVREGEIFAFFQTELGRKLQKGVKIVREFKFSILDDGSRYGPDLEGEQILLQGVVDCAILEPEGITILDFKTDFVTEQTLPSLIERYRLQIDAYAEAMGRIFEKRVLKKLLYFFRLGRFVELPEIS